MSNTITATLVSGTAQSVSFSASGLPTGATASFSPGSCSPTCSPTLTLTTSASTPAGSSTITVTGLAGSLSHTSKFTLTVNATPPPTVSITSPVNGASVSGTITVSATASSNAAGVQFQLDGTNLGAEATASPCSVSWNSTTTSNGSHTLTAIARDGAGNRGTSSPVTVTVSNTAPATAAKWTGAGKIAVSGGSAYFGLKVIRDTTGSLKGRVSFRNAANGFSFYSSNILALSVTGNQAVFTGTGQESVNNGPWSSPFNFTVTVQDVEPSGDTFKIDISDPSGTTAGSTTTPIIRGSIEQYY